MSASLKDVDDGNGIDDDAVDVNDVEDFFHHPFLCPNHHTPPPTTATVPKIATVPTANLFGVTLNPPTLPISRFQKLTGGTLLLFTALGTWLAIFSTESFSTLVILANPLALLPALLDLSGEHAETSRERQTNKLTHFFNCNVIILFLLFKSNVIILSASLRGIVP
jgi:hypothetical protein